MRYKNGLQINVGDIAIKDNGDAVLVTSVSKYGFCGLSRSGERISFYSQQDSERFCLHKTSLLQDVFDTLKNIGAKEWFNSLPYDSQNMALALTIGHTIQNNHKNQGVVLGFTNEGKEATLICEHDKRINISDKSINYCIEGENLHKYLYTQFQKVYVDNI